MAIMSRSRNQNAAAPERAAAAEKRAAGDGSAGARGPRLTVVVSACRVGSLEVAGHRRIIARGSGARAGPLEALPEEDRVLAGGTLEKGQVRAPEEQAGALVHAAARVIQAGGHDPGDL